jgi:hypothetical protein
MTAEIAVMNKWAVALAADSKVTISGTAAAKTYDTVNKVFTLSKVHPVGIMIFGNAEFMEYPWETVIKLYRRQKGIESEDYVQDWGDDFLRYLRRFGKIDRAHKDQNIRNILASWFAEFVRQASDHAPKHGISIGSPPFIALLKKMLDERAKAIAESGVALKPAQLTALLKAHGRAIVGPVQSFFGSFGNDDLVASAVQFAITALVHEETSPHCSGIVIAGFGEREFFPTVIEYETDGYVGRSIKIIQKPTADLSRTNPSCIRAFAQKDMVQRFMNGIDSGFMGALFSSFGTILAQQCLSVLDEYGSRLKKKPVNRDAIADKAKSVMKDFGKDVGNHVRENFSDPVIGMVALLPKDELAHLAESLVALTSLKRRVSSDAETVGGPIDVALISKGDGFVWIKRKHYFPPDLNHQFARNYLKDYSTEGSRHAKSGRHGAPRRPAKAGPAGGSAGGGGKGKGAPAPK